MVIFLILSRIRFQQNGLGETAVPNTSSIIMAEELTSENDDIQTGDPSHISEKIEANLIVDADVETQAKSGVSYTVGAIDFTEEKANSLMKELTGHDVLETNYAGTNFWLNGVGNSRLCFVENSLNFQQNTEMDDALLSVLQIWDEEHRAERQEKDLDFASLEECKAEVLRMMQRFTDMDTEIIRINAVSADTIQSFYIQLHEEGEFTAESPVDFTVMGDAYLVYAGYRQNGLPVYKDTVEAQVESNMMEDVAKSCLVKAVVSKDGIRYFDMDYPMVIQSQQDIQLISAREALDRALPSLKNQILTQKVTIDRIYLEYVAITSSDYFTPDVLRPYWVIHYQTEGSSSYLGNAIRINANTGEDLVYGK